MFLSGLLSFEYSKYSDDVANNSGWLFIPELSRFAFSYRINRGMFFEAGRIAYNDVTGFVAGGLFDGLRFSAATSFGGISAGAFYTGFLYKETAKITMTGGDILRYANPWDFDNFGDYFASRRAFAAFTPLSSVTQGAVFPATLTGLALIGADYSVKIINSLFAECAMRYFIRAFDDPAASGSLYGGELWASFTWQPLEDIRAALGAGAFFPGLGNAYPSGADVMWKVSASVTLSL